MTNNTTFLYSDAFISYLRNNPRALSHVLKCVLPGISLKITRLFRYEEKTLYPPSIAFDRSIVIFAEDSSGKLYDIDLVIADKEYHRKQACFHANCLINCGRYPHKEHVEVYTIMLADCNLLDEDSQTALSNIEWYCNETGQVLPNADHIIYVNGAYKDDSTDIGKLIFDLQQTDFSKFKSTVFQNAFQNEQNLK